MFSKRKFWKTEVHIEVLSEIPFEWDSLEDIQYAITEGDCSSRVLQGRVKKLDATQAVTELLKQGSSPEFFGLTEKGEEASDA